MKFVPRSLFGRLLAGATVMTAIALIFAAFSIGHILERFVMAGLDDRLDAQVALIARAVRNDGTLDPALVVNLPQFERRGSGWSWEVRAPSGTLRSPSLGSATLPVPATIDPPRPPPPPPRGGGPPPPPPPGSMPAPYDGLGSNGERQHYRWLAITTTAGSVRIIASGPRRIVEQPVREALVPLLASLAILGFGLAAAFLALLYFGLKPLRRLARSLVEVRAGRRRHIPSNQPVELKNVVAQLNGLIDQNENALDNARRHVANLAHGLKTPLAALSIKLDERGEGDGELADLVDSIDRHVRHHLGRARAATPGVVGRAPELLEPHIRDLADVLSRIHAGRHVTAAIDIDPAIRVACDRQDIVELAGNLLDNAWGWARSRVLIEARRDRDKIVMTIDDDGPGMSREAQRMALVEGGRLDEQGDGHGFGLPIARELAELYGGALVLAPSEMGGLRCVVTLPPALE